MNNSFLIFFFLLFYNSQDLKVISYNIRYNNPNDGINIWENRRSTIGEFISNENPDFIGMQEVVYSQLFNLIDDLPNYSYVGVGRDDGKTKGEYSPILFSNIKYEVLKSNTFWLSETPNKISVGWDASMERICTYGLFQNKHSKEKIWVFNTHFDHIGIKSRKQSVDLIIKKITELNKMNFPLVLTGDFNLIDENISIKKLQNLFVDSQKNLSKSNKFYGTFNGFDTKNDSDKRIDYVFFKNLTLINAKHVYLKTPVKGWASDHHPVVSTLKYIK